MVFGLECIYNVNKVFDNRVFIESVVLSMCLTYRLGYKQYCSRIFAVVRYPFGKVFKIGIAGYMDELRWYPLSNHFLPRQLVHHAYGTREIAEVRVLF